jgi:hypothetical protein
MFIEMAWLETLAQAHRSPSPSLIAVKKGRTAFSPFRKMVFVFITRKGVVKKSVFL